MGCNQSFQVATAQHARTEARMPKTGKPFNECCKRSHGQRNARKASPARPTREHASTKNASKNDGSKASHTAFSNRSQPQTNRCERHDATHNETPASREANSNGSGDAKPPTQTTPELPCKHEDAEKAPEVTCNVFGTQHRSGRCQAPYPKRP